MLAQSSFDSRFFGAMAALVASHVNLESQSGDASGSHRQHEQRLRETVRVVTSIA